MGGGGGGGVPPHTVGSFLIFRLKMCNLGQYLRRKFRLDDMYYMGKLVMELNISHGLILLGGGASAPKPPPPPHQYASGGPRVEKCALSLA